MFRNYLISAIRNLKKTKLFSLINILGLTVGMTACLLILHYVGYEKSYDGFHEDSDRIYRLRYERSSEEGKTVKFASCTPPAPSRIRGKYPEVEKIAGIFRHHAAVSFGDITFIEERMYFAEPDFLDILKFKFIKGDPLEGIREPNTAFISQSTARKYFGDSDPMGKSFSVDKKTDYKVTGIFADIPQNSHIKFDILLSFKNLISWLGPDYHESWGHTGIFTYLRLKPGADPKAFENKLPALVEAECGKMMKTYKVHIMLKMQPLSAIHMTSHFMQEYEINGDRDSVNFLFIIALFIIIMAWVNYINLSTARSLTRAKEVGLRKVAGASRGQLMVQFFFETTAINLAALPATFECVNISLPFFTRITGTPLSYSIWQQSWFWPVIALMFTAGVFLSGLYPIAVMSSFDPAAVLKGKLGHSVRGISLRKALVMLQFVMALALITGTFTVYRQIGFMKSRDLGFDKEQVLVVRAPRVRDDSFKSKFKTFKETLMENSHIQRSCVVTEVPGRQIFWDAGAIKRAGENEGKNKNYYIVGIDYDFADVFDLEFVHGRNFSKERPADKDALILNETGIKWMGFKNSREAVGQQVDYWGQIYTIIGVLKDYHQQSLKSAFEPQIYRLMPYGKDVRGFFAVKIGSPNLKETVDLVKRNYDTFFPGNPFEYFFLDDYYEQQYKGDELFGNVFALFSFLSIFVTGLGIFGLSSFMAVQRTKEIGIRKVLGAGVAGIVLLLTKDFLKLIAISFAIALPLSYIGIDQWLNLFANRMSPDVWLFLLPLVIVTLITFLTTSSHVFRAALINPTESLKCE